TAQVGGGAGDDGLDLGIADGLQRFQRADRIILVGLEHHVELDAHRLALRGGGERLAGGAGGQPRGGAAKRRAGQELPAGHHHGVFSRVARLRWESSVSAARSRSLNSSRNSTSTAAAKPAAVSQIGRHWCATMPWASVAA